MALMSAAAAHQRRGDLESAYSLLEQASLAADSLETALEKGDVWAAFATVCLDMGKAEMAEKWMRLAIEDSVGGSPLVMGARRTMLGMALKELGRYDEALVEMRAGVAWSFFPVNAAPAKFHLADLLQFLGETAEARALLEEIIPTFEMEAIASAFPFQAISTYLNYGWILFEAGEAQEATRWMQRAVVRASESGSPIAEILACTRLADLLHRLDRFEEAHPLCVRAAMLARTTPGTPGKFAAAAYLELSTNHLSAGRNREAEEALRIAAAMTHTLDDTVMEFNVALAECELAKARWDLAGALIAARRAMGMQLGAVGSNPYLYGIIHAMGRQAGLFDFAVTITALWAAARREQGERPVLRIIHSTEDGVATTLTGLANVCEADILAIVDAARCAHVREGLARHLASNPGSVAPQAWRAGPQPWQRAFRDPPAADHGSLPEPRRARGRIAAAVDDAHPASRLRLDANDPIKNRLCELIREDEILSLIPDERTVLLQFFFIDDDLWIVPAWRDADRVVVLPALLIRHGVRSELADLAAMQFKRVASLLDARVSDLDATGFLSLYERVWELIGGEDLLSALEREMQVPRSDLHLVIIPDGPLCEMPLHALPVDRAGMRLYETVQSVRHALSLRTLRLQQEVPATAAAEVRGVLYADADQLPGVRTEVALLVEESPESWWVHGDGDVADARATPENFLARHRSGNLLWVCGHGAVIEAGDAETFALQLCEGRIGSRDLLTRPFDFTPVEMFVLSACWLGRLEPGRAVAREIDGYQAILALRGCRRVTSAIWPLDDESAPVFAAFYFREIRRCFREHADPHRFAVAFKNAIQSLRRYDEGLFDHEFFWAPYTLYGLG